MAPGIRHFRCMNLGPGAPVMPNLRRDWGGCQVGPVIPSEDVLGALGGGSGRTRERGLSTKAKACRPRVQLVV